MVIQRVCCLCDSSSVTVQADSHQIIPRRCCPSIDHKIPLTALAEYYIITIIIIRIMILSLVRGYYLRQTNITASLLISQFNSTSTLFEHTALNKTFKIAFHLQRCPRILPRRLPAPARRLFSTSLARPAFATGPSPPRLPPKEQEEFERLQKQSTGAFSTPRTTPQVNQSPGSKAQINQSPAGEADALKIRVEATREGRGAASGC